ncbi:MAG: nucleoside deaminase [Desulfobacterales bacterium]|nr:nucleoside deaminase [Desulfobacterales bacterium]
MHDLHKKIASFKPKYKHDSAALITISEAIIASKEGNYGIGACLINEITGEIILRGHNRLFKPYFRSDMHAEMDVLNQYENKNQNSKSDELVLYTSLEPCPMCLTRIITAGIQKTYYLSKEPYSGMVHLLNNLPPIWQEIASGRIYEEAQCSEELKEMSKEVFLFSSKILDERLRNGNNKRLYPRDNRSNI